MSEGKCVEEIERDSGSRSVDLVLYGGVWKTGEELEGAFRASKMETKGDRRCKLWPAMVDGVVCLEVEG